MLNLLHNALRYNEPDGWVGVSLAARQGQVELEVCNGGPGIPAADQPKIFDRFFRADAARSRRVDGVGLGLSLAREIVSAHRGRLLLKESRSGRTCFTLTLPGESSPDSAGLTANSNPKPNRTNPPTNEPS
jgi:signal transduction histidine kinase